MLESLFEFSLHDTLQVTIAMQDSEKLHYVTIIPDLNGRLSPACVKFSP